jgi:hypothetical protein
MMRFIWFLWIRMDRDDVVWDVFGIVFLSPIGKPGHD